MVGRRWLDGTRVSPEFYARHGRWRPCGRLYHARNRMGSLHIRRSRAVSLLRAAGTGYIALSKAINRGGHEIDVVVFTTHHRTVPAQASPRDGAVDADARGKAVAGAPAAQCGILCAARHAGRPDHRRASPVAATAFGSPGVPGIYSDAQIKGWREVVDAVHAKGGVIFLQLWHVGRVSHSSFQPGGVLPVAPSAVPIPPDLKTGTADGKSAAYETPRALETSEVAGVVDAFRQAAANAKAAGFDGAPARADGRGSPSPPLPSPGWRARKWREGRSGARRPAR